MKLLVVCQYYYPEPFRIHDLCEQMVQNGHEVTVLTGLPNYPDGKVLAEYKHGKHRREIVQGVNIIRCPIVGRGSSKWMLFINYISFVISGVVACIRLRENFDVVMVHQLSPVLMAIPGMVYKKIHKTPLLIYCLDLWPASLVAGGVKENTFIYKLFMKISRWIYNDANAIKLTSISFKEYFIETLNVDPRKLEYLPQYAEENFLECVATPSNKGGCDFVFAGNIGEMQSVETIILAIKELKEVRNLRIHIVGDGSRLKHCRQLVTEWDLNNVTFYGRRPVEEMPSFYNMADAMIVTLKDDPIISKTLPGKVQSYMAAGKPIIGAINGETADVIKAARCGLICDAEDYQGLSRIIQQFSESMDQHVMAENARKYYNEHFTKAHFFRKLESKLLELSGGKYV